MTVRLYVGSPFSNFLPFGCGLTAHEVSEEEGSYASRFYRWFLESFKSCLLLLVALPGLIDTLAQLLAWRSLLWLSMIWWWMYLTQSDFLSTTSLAWSLALRLLFCFSQEKPLRLKEINTHTHTHTVSKFLVWARNYHLSNLGLRWKVNKAHIIYIAILPWPDQAWEILRFFSILKNNARPDFEWFNIDITSRWLFNTAELRWRTHIFMS